MRERSQTPAKKAIARERIAILFREARGSFSRDPRLSDRYVLLSRRIAMRQQIRIEREFRRQYCHICHSFLVPGSNMRVRVRSGHVVVTCLICKGRNRYQVGR